MIERIRHGFKKFSEILDTSISCNGDDIIIRGYHISDLIQNSDFEEAAYLLLHSNLPNRGEYDRFKAKLVRSRSNIPDITSKIMNCFSGSEHSVDILSMCFKSMSLSGHGKVSENQDERLDKALSVISLYPYFLAKHIRKREKRTHELEEKLELSISDRFIYDCFGQENKFKAEVIKKIQIGGCDMVLAPSTFGARITASTHSDFFSCISTALNVWKGPRHGGASEMAFRDLSYIVNEKPSINDHYRRKQDNRIPLWGFGHPIYKKGDDPRVSVIKPISKLCYDKFGGELYPTMSEVISELEKKKIFPNPNIYFASICDSLGFKAEDVSAIGFMGRIAGVSAHIIEEKGPLRPMYVPKALYTGQKDKSYISIDQR